MYARHEIIPSLNLLPINLVPDVGSKPLIFQLFQFCHTGFMLSPGRVLPLKSKYSQAFREKNLARPAESSKWHGFRLIPKYGSGRRRNGMNPRLRAFGARVS